MVAEFNDMTPGSWRSSRRISNKDLNVVTRGGSIPARDYKSANSIDQSHKTIAT